MPGKILCVFSLISFCSFSQFSKENRDFADSLLTVVQSDKNSLNVATAYLELSEVYSLIDLDSVFYFAEKAKTVATKGHKSLVSPDKKVSYKAIIAGANNNIGYAHYNKGDLPNALKYHKIALDIWKEIDDQANVGQALNNLGVVYRKLEEYKKALKFFTEALKTYQAVGDEQPMAITYNNLGGTYKMLEMDDKAMESYEQSLILRKKIGDKRGAATTLNNIGSLYKKHGDLDSALHYFTESLELIELVGDQMGIAHASCNIGEIAFLRNNQPLAIQMGKRALKIGEDLGALLIIEQASALLQRIYAKSGDWKIAYEMQSLNINTSLKIKSEEAKKSAMMLEMQYEFDKQKEIDHVNHQKNSAISKKQKQIQKTSIYFISICLILATIFSLLLYKRYKIMRSQKGIIEKQNNERKIMLQEIHHRVKNNFQIISSMLRLQIYKDGSPLLRSAFQEAINRIHTMAIVHEIIYKQDEFDAVDAKMYLENLISNLHQTFENKQVVIDIDSCKENLGIEQTIPLGIIVNELITNSFKHAFYENYPNPRIFISLEKLNDLFILNYKDNGVGFESLDIKNSFGLELIETVVEQISGKVEVLKDVEWNTHIKISFVKTKS